MRHDLTAVFDNQGDAQHVLDELLIAGYPCAGTTLVSPPAAGVDGHMLKLGRGGTIKQVLARLFRPAHHETESVDEPTSIPGRHVITISSAAELDAVRAIGIIELSNPVYIEDRHKQAGHDRVDAAPTLAAEAH